MFFFSLDRGDIDNIIWVFIMTACNPKMKNNLVNELFAFLNAHFNEASITGFIQERGVIFIDPYPNLNSKRMMERGQNGDAYRSRLHMYNYAQFITYYTIGRLFGWPIYVVPYNNMREYNPQEYEIYIEEILKYFNEPIKEINMEKFVQFKKPPNNYPIDNTYPISVGIFK